VVQGLGGEPLAGQRLTGREQLFTPRFDANIVLVARSLAPVHYIQCTESFSISAHDVPCHSFRKAGIGYEGNALAAPHAGDLLAYD
jgi:hypothetical protein